MNRSITTRQIINNSLLYIWLDDTVEKTRQGKDTKSLIRQIVRGRLKTYENPDQCFLYLNERTEDDKVFLILSNKFGPLVAQAVHDLPQVQEIYIYCSNKKFAEEWSKPFQKIKGIFRHRQELLQQLSKTINEYEGDSHLPMSVFHLSEKQNSLQNLSEESATFMWYQSIVTVIRLMAKQGNSKDEMIKECRAHYHNNKAAQEKMDEFEQQYNPSEAFLWYTSDSFLYRTLNEALRTQNFDIIFKFRFFINDLHLELKKLYLKDLEEYSSKSINCLKLYRGQKLSIEELDLLKNNVNELISMNSFLSTTLNENVANIFSGIDNPKDVSSSLESVVFIIDIHHMNKDTTPFGSIAAYSCCKEEEEILFSMGATFRVQEVVQHGHGWHVHLTFTEEENKLSRDLYRYMMKEIGPEPNLLSFSWFLYRMGEYDKAERSCISMMKQLPKNDVQNGQVYNLLGLISKDCGLINRSIEYYSKALEISSQGGSANIPELISIHYNIGLAYLALNKERNADEHRRLADEKLKEFPSGKYPMLGAMKDTLVAKIKMLHDDYQGAYEKLQEILQLKRTILPDQHPSIASTLTDMGIAQEKLKNNSLALTHFQEALDIGLKSLASKQLDLIAYRINVGRIYCALGKYKLALEQFKKAAEISCDDREDEPDRGVALEQYIFETEAKLK